MKKNYLTKNCFSLKTILLFSFFVLLKTNSFSQTTNINISICAGDTIIIDSMPVYTPGTYIDTLVNIAGGDSIVVTNVTVIPITTSTQSFIWCQGIVLVLPGGGTVSQPGTYTDTLISSNGCDSIVTTNFWPCGQYNFPVVQNGNMLIVSSPITNSSYTWAGTGIVSGATNDTVVINTPGTYTVTITDLITGCTCTSTGSVQTIGINEAGIENAISVYPNPSNGVFEFNGIKNGSQILITDITGKIIYTDKVVSEKHKINLTNKAKGVYFYKIEYNGIIYGIGKLVIK